MQTHSLDSNECFSFAAEQQYAAKQAVLMGVYPFCVRPRDVCAFCETKPKGTLMKKESPGQAQAKPADQPQDQPQSEDQPKAADQSESYYNPRSEKFPHALKHGAFSALSILPGEDPKEFIELYQSIAAELLPDGPIEKDAVKTIALSIWRASRLTIFRRAEWARAKYGEDEQKPGEVPETEPARSQYKKLIDSAKQHERAGHVLHDIATMKIEKHIEVLNTAAAELNKAGLKGFQNEVQVLNSAALQCLPDSEVQRITDFVASQEQVSDPHSIVIDLLNAAKARGLPESEAKKMLDDAMIVAKGRNYLSLSDLLKIAEDDYQLAMRGDVLTEEHLEKELAIIERLDARISRAMKTLMQAKAMKEIIGTDPKSRAARAKLDVKKKT